MEERFDELKTRLAEIHDLRRALELLFWDQTVMMPPGRRAGPGAAADDARPDRAREVRRRRDRRAPRRARRVRAAARLRLRRGVADPDDAPRLRQGSPRPRRARRRDDRRGRRGARRLGEGARGERLRALPPPPRARGRAEAPLHRVLRGLRRAVRRAPRRLRAGDEDGRGARGLRRPEGGARAADRRDRLGRRRRRRSCPARGRSTPSTRTRSRSSSASASTSRSRGST